jgi:hypothetical protein
LGTSPRRCALIDDQTTDVPAARAIGAGSIGYANKPGKADDLTAAGADAVIATIDELTQGHPHQLGRAVVRHLMFDVRCHLIVDTSPTRLMAMAIIRTCR